MYIASEALLVTSRVLLNDLCTFIFKVCFVKQMFNNQDYEALQHQVEKYPKSTVCLKTRWSASHSSLNTNWNLTLKWTYFWSTASFENVSYYISSVNLPIFVRGPLNAGLRSSSSKLASFQLPMAFLNNRELFFKISRQ